MTVPDRPVVLVDAAMPDAPLARVSEVAELVRYDGEAGLDRRIDLHGDRVVGLGVQLQTPIGDDRLGRLPSLVVVADCAVGYDNVDVAAATARGIAVTHTPDVLTEATADLTWALILAVARRLREGDALARSGAWEGWSPTQLLGLELAGATLAILGMGRIGEAVARRGRAFGMEIVYWSRSAQPEVERELGARRADLDEALGAADVVSIHLPLTAETTRLVDARRLAAFKPGAILVNAARGPIVDEDAVADALASGRLAGVGFDVHEKEPEIHPRIAASERSVLLPHLGSATVATRERMAERMARNLVAVIRGEEPPDRVPEQKGSLSLREPNPGPDPV